MLLLQELQKNILRLQLDLAARMGLPVILHMREAKDALHEQCAGDLLQILEAWIAGLRLAKNPLAERPGVLHSFSGSLETARQAHAPRFLHRRDRPRHLRERPGTPGDRRRVCRWTIS